jgi:hypothetical protein
MGMELIERQREFLGRETLTAATSPQCAATEQLLRSVSRIGPIRGAALRPQRPVTAKR